LLETFGLPQEHLERPVIGIVSRFADQKGFDLIAEIANEVMKEDLVLVVLGTGDKKYEKLFAALAATYPGRVGVKIAYDNILAHKVEAGADMFLMPSRYEPSGLNQMYSLKYGTVPIVRATGGLDDSIQPFDVEHGTGTGFKFKEYSGEALLYAVRQALHHYMDERIWKRIQLNGMAKDFSWKGPAKEYAKLYEAARVSRGFAPTVQKAEKLGKTGKTEVLEKIAGVEKEAKVKAETPVRRGARKAAQAPAQAPAQISPAAVEASQEPAKLEAERGQNSQEALSAQDVRKDSESSGPEPLEESGQAPRSSGQAGRNQKPATTSN
jgi:hypothetical protein